MFYAHFVLSKRGPLARVWLAAHWDKKLTKAQIFETDIDGSVEAIIKPKVKLALRTSGHLLLGVVRIYSRKAKYLLNDCSEAFLKIRLAFRPGLKAIELDDDAREAPLTAINMAEPLYDFDTTIVDFSEFDFEKHFTVHQGQHDDITLREEIFMKEVVRVDDFTFDDFIEMADDIELFAQRDTEKSFNSPNAPHQLAEELQHNEKKAIPMEHETTFMSGSDDFGGPMNEDVFEKIDGEAAARLFEESLLSLPPLNEGSDPYELDRREPIDTMQLLVPSNEQTAVTVLPEQTTLISNDTEAFALEPVDASTTLSVCGRRGHRKRKLIVDTAKSIPSSVMKEHMAKARDTNAPLLLAPPSKKAMRWTAIGGTEGLLTIPGRQIVSKCLRKHYLDNMISRPVLEEDPPVDKDDRAEDAGLTPISEHTEPNSARESNNGMDILLLPDVEVVRENSADESTIAGGPRDSILSIAEASSIVSDHSILPEKLLHEVSNQKRVTRQSLKNNLTPLKQHDMQSSIQLTPANPVDIQLSPARSSILPTPSFQQTPVRQNLQWTPAGDFRTPYRTSQRFEGSITPSAGGQQNSPGLLLQINQNGQRSSTNDIDELSQATRKQHLVNLLKPHIVQPYDKVLYRTIVSKCNRRQVAAQFSTLLTLAKMQVVSLSQTQPFDDIVIGQGLHFKTKL